MALFNTLVDNFDDNSIDSGLFNADPDIVETGQQIVLSADTTGGNFTDLSTVAYYDLTDNSLSVEIAALVDYIGGTNVYLYPVLLFDSSGRSVSMRVYNNQLQANWGTPTTTTIASIAYNITNHKFLRISYQSGDGKYYYEHSADSQTWSVLASSSAPTATETSLRYYARHAKSPSTTVTMNLDNLNVYFLNGTAASTSATPSSAAATVIYTTAISSISTSSSTATALIITQTTEIPKTYFVKIYEADGTYIGIWKDRSTNDFEYYQQINNGGSVVKFRLARSARNRIEFREAVQAEDGSTLETEDSRPIEAVYEQFKTIGEGTDADLNYRVDVYMYEGSVEAIETEDGEILQTEAGNPIEATLGSPDGKRIYSGFISKYAAYYGDTEYVDVWAAHHSNELDNAIVNDGANTTVTLNSYDPSNMLKAILDQYITDGGTITYDTASIDLTGSTSSYTFRLTTVHEAIDKILELSPDGWYWYIDQGTNKLHFHQKSVTPDHTFIYGKHIQNIRVERHIEDLVNRVYFAGGGDPQLLKTYQDTPSQTAWRLGTRIITDSRVTTAASAQILSEAAIDRGLAPVYASEVRILDAQYRVEEIKLGQTVTFANFGNFIDTIELTVVSIDYSRHGVDLGLGTLLPEVNKRLEEVKRNLRLEETINVTDAPV